MNIFEALEAGNGKATLRGDRSAYACREGNKFTWHSHFSCKVYVEDEELKSNNWLPYVTPKIKNKHKEIHENTMVIQNMDGGWFMIQAVGKTEAKLPMRMTLEWEE